jgi:PAS domain S-box-containing protein
MKRIISQKIPLRLLAVFLPLTAGILIGGYYFYQAQTTQTENHIKNDLETIAKYKVEQIRDWRRERYGNAYVITSSEMFATSVRRWFSSPDDKFLTNYIYHRLDAFRIYNVYKDAILTDPTGKIRMFIDQGGVEKFSQATLDIVRQAVKKDGILFSDFYYCEQCQEVHLDMAAPIHDNKGLVAVVVLRIDPEKFLYPLIQTWPGLSKTGETVLVRKEGDRILFLNDLRHSPGAAMKLQLPIADTLLPAAMAVLGHEGLVEGLDYRGVPVLACIHHIPDSPWYMVVKMDKEEIYAPLFRQRRNIGFAVLLALAVAGMALGFFWQAERKEFYKRQHQLELDKKALIRHYDYLTMYANDIIILMDENYRLLEVNERAVQAYGHRREEMLGQKAEMLRDEVARPQFSSQMEEAIAKGGLLFETVHRRKDGSTFPVEVSTRPIEIEGKMYLQGIVRNIAERKQYELDIKERNAQLEAANQELIASEEELRAADEELRQQMEELHGTKEVLKESEERYHSLFDNSMVGIYRTTPEGRILMANPALVRMLGFGSFEELAKRNLEKAEYFNSTLSRETFKKRIETEGVVSGWETAWKNSSGEMVYVRESARAIKDVHGKTAYYDGTVEDITARRLSEQKLQESEQKYRSVFENTGSATVIIEEDATISLANAEFERLSGYSREEIEGKKKWTEFTVPQDRERMLAYHKRRRQNGILVPTKYEFDFRDRGGNVKNILLTVDMIKGTNKSVASLVDITERRRAENIVKESERNLQMILDSVSFGVMIFDKDKKLLQANKAALNMADYRSFDEIKGVVCHRNLCPAEEGKCPILDLHQQVDKSERTLLTKAGQKIPILKSAVNIILNGEEVLLESFIDITDLKKAEESIKNQLFELQRWQSVMLDREDRVRELKKEVNRLLGQLGETEKYM